LNEKSAIGDLAVGEADLAQGAREAEAVQQTEDQRHRPGKAAHPGRLRLVPREIDGEGQHARGDQDLDRAGGQPRITQRGEGEGDRVGRR
jgi:hypothetical protein